MTDSSTASPHSGGDPTQTSAWHRLQHLAASVGSTPIRVVAERPREGLLLSGAGWELDLTRQRVDSEVVTALLNLAEETGVPEARAAMRAGEHINTTEDRAVLHMALRSEPGESWSDAGVPVTESVHEALGRMTALAEAIRSGRWHGATGKQITRIVNIGIGGSDLGPAMVYQALADYRDPNISCVFVSNVDPADIHDALAASTPDETLVIVSSKTFTTRETMANADVARAWIVKELGEAAVARHFLAVSTNVDAAVAFGIPDDSVVGFWEWVGGRYSVDSAIGLSVMIAIGPEAFHDLLRGFREMDQHFLSAPLGANLPVVMALCGIWNRCFLGIESVAVLPYSHRLARFPAYLQQLTMESNGKSVRKDGAPLTYPSSPVYWGEPGTNGQHSFFQLLHQGTSDVACDIIVLANSSCEPDTQHEALVANALAQASILSMGYSAEELRDEGVDPSLIPHKIMPGNRPVTLLMTRSLTPRTLGALIALYEHVVFVQGVVWGINSFDQWGVELGKRVATGIEKDIRNGRWDDPALDTPTQASLRLYLRLRSEG